MKGTIRYQRELQKTYMIVSGCDKGLMENYAGQMIMRGTVRGLAECRSCFIDGEWEVWYDVTSLQSLEQSFAVKEMSFSELKSLIRQLLLVLEEMEKCLLTNRQLCFEPQHLYMDMEKEQIRFVYDYTECKVQSDINRLAEYLLERICHEDEKAVDLAYFFYEQVQKENFSVKELEAFLETEPLDVNPMKKEIMPPTEPKPDMVEQEPGYFKPEQPDRTVKRDRWKLDWESAGGKMLEGGLACICMVIFSGIGFWIISRYFALSKMEVRLWMGATISLFAVGMCLAIFGFIKEKVLQNKDRCQSREPENDFQPEESLTEEAEFYRQLIEEKTSEANDGRTVYVGNALLNRNYYLVERRNGEEKRHPVSSYPFLIGKEKGRVNLVVKDLSVSRIHARLVEEEGGVYIEDLHSTNGTYLNDLLLEPHKRIKLKKGDMLQFGKMEFDFC